MVRTFFILDISLVFKDRARSTLSEIEMSKKLEPLYVENWILNPIVGRYGDVKFVEVEYIGIGISLDIKDRFVSVKKISLDEGVATIPLSKRTKIVLDSIFQPVAVKKIYQWLTGEEA